MSYKPIAPAPTSSGAAGTSSSSASPAPGAPPVGKSPRLPARPPALFPRPSSGGRLEAEQGGRLHGGVAWGQWPALEGCLTSLPPPLRPFPGRFFLGLPEQLATSVPSPSGSVPGTSAPFRPLFNDFGPPSMGYVQAMKPPGAQGSQSTYTDLLSVIEEMGKEIRPTYAGSKSAMERLKRGIIHARALVRECLAETERNART